MLRRRTTEQVAAALNAKLTRRGFMAITVGSGIYLVACGGSDREPAARTTATTGTSDTTGGTAATPESGSPSTGGSDMAVLGDLRTTYDSRRFPQLPGWQNGPKSGGTIKLAWDAPTNWDLVGPTAGELASWSPRHFNQLVTFKKGDHADNHNLELEGDLAESWEEVDPTTYLFKIHQGVKWQDLEPMNGRELTAADIQYALEVYKAESPVISPLLEVVESISTPDDYTLQIKLQEPAPYFLRSLAQPPFQIFGKEAYESTEGLKNWPVGTGAFILTDQGSRVGMKMKKNPTYFKKDADGNQLPYLDTIETVYVPDTATHLAGFRSGDFAHYSFWVDTVDTLYDLLESNPDIVPQVNPPAPTGQIHILFRLDKEPWSDVRVRRALSLAINRDAIIEAVYKGVATYSQPMDWSYLGSEWPLEAGDLGPYMRYDPEQAKALLAEAGHESGITATMPSQWTAGTSLNVLELIQADWRKIGVDVQIETPESAAFFQQMYSASYEDLIGVYYLTQGTDPDNFTYELMHSKSPKNIYHISDPQVDELCEQQRVEMDPAKRLDIVRQIMDIELDQVYRLWAVNPYQIMVRQPWVYNYTDGLYAWADGWAAGVAEIVWTDKQ
jgi:peptide/nickel transport system substrate-binding protein